MVLDNEVLLLSDNCRYFDKVLRDCLLDVYAARRFGSATNVEFYDYREAVKHARSVF